MHRLPAHGGSPLTRSWFWSAAGLSLAADLVSKWAAWRWLAAAPEKDAVPLLGEWLVFTLHFNPGGVWGMLPGRTVILLAVTAVLLPAIVLMAYSCRVERAPYWALGMLLGSAAGNLYDRLGYGAVRDFIQVDLGIWPVNHWPIFNVADAGIVVGVVVFLVWNLFLAPPETAGGTDEAKGPP